jgi:hypothetical protein
MRLFIKVIFILISLTILSAEEKFLLIDGTVIKGEITSESDLSITVKTNYGEINIRKSDLLQLEYEVELNSGEKFRGLKIADGMSEITLKTNMGELTIKKSEILDIKEVDKITSKKDTARVQKYEKRRPYSLADLLFGSRATSKSFNPDAKFALGEERLIDTFFDPRAEVLEDGTLYLSGLSFAFGVSEKLQVSSRWMDYFWGNFNIRPKYQIFKKGNWEKESALAIGGHFHTFWQPDKVTWQTGDAVVTNIIKSGNSETTTYDTLNYGGFFPMGATIKGNQIETHTDCFDCGEDEKLRINETDKLDFMFEFFTAYTFSKARKGMKGRISSTIGALVQVPLGYDDYPYRLFGSLDIDVTPQLKLIGEAFYDPYFLDMNNRSGSEDCFLFDCYSGHWTYETDQDEKITEDQFETIRPIHFDFGFMYAVNEHFRIGIHNQPYIVAFYWKF